MDIRFFNSATAGVRSNAMGLFVCLSISLSAHISQTTVQTSRNSLYVLIVAVARSSSDDNAIWYVIRFVDDVLFAHNPARKGVARRAYTQSDSPGQNRGRSLISTIVLFPVAVQLFARRRGALFASLARQRFGCDRDAVGAAVCREEQFTTSSR